ncbi:MAG TPA: SCO family protein [Aliidongia sp.]|nr:SCO family protein [Aliidongia sp.]
MNRWLWGMFGAAAVALLAIVGVYAYGQMGPQGGRLAVGGPFSLVDGDGRTVTDRDFHGKLMMIYFGYTRCPDACPTALNDMALALDKLGDQRKLVQPIFITVDPERDTGKVVKDYVAAFGPDFIGLTGPLPDIKAAEKEFHVYAAKHQTKDGDYDMDHSSIIYVMDRSGQFVGNFTHETDPDQMAATLNQLAGNAKATS